VDELDSALVRMLQNNGRQTNRDLAAQLGIAPSTCLQRIRALRERGIIRGYHAEIDLPSLGRSTQAMVSIRLLPQALAKMDSFRDYVSALPETLAMFMLSGPTDFLFHVAVQDTDHLRDFVLGLAKRPEIADIRTSVIYQHQRKTTLESLAADELTTRRT
jgi:DNA-binding Lrp family transcriptional regulator